MHSEGDKPLGKLSPFLVSKVVEGVIGANYSAKKMASDDLLVEVNTKQQSDALLKLNLVSDYKTVKAGYLQCRVRPYVPNPQRCFECQRFGHGSRNCRGRDTCAKFSSKEHVADACDNEPHCANCGGNHPAYSRSCPVWKDEKEVITLKVTENITYTEAKKRFAFVKKGSYAEAVRRGPARPVVSMGTQTSPDDLHLPSRSPSKLPGAAPVAPPPNRKRKPGEVPRQSTSRVQLPAAADEPMDKGGAYTLGARCLVSSVTTDPSHVGHHTRTQGAPALGTLVVELSPGYVWTLRGPPGEAIHRFDLCFS
ncbi:uncharacterized protein ISCGN_014176 [Ixodes scapularis]